MHGSSPGLLHPRCILMLWLHCLTPCQRSGWGGSTLRSSLTISSSELLPSSDASMSSVRSAGVPYLDVLDETGDEEVDDGGGRGRTLSVLMGRDSRSNLPASSRSLEPDVADSAFLSTKGLGGVRAVGARRGGSFGVPVSRLVRAVVCL